MENKKERDIGKERERETGKKRVLTIQNPSF